jgi:hypothetical protein
MPGFVGSGTLFIYDTSTLLLIIIRIYIELKEYGR